MARTMSFHQQHDAKLVNQAAVAAMPLTSYRYTFDNFFHPFVDQLIEKLNRDSLAGLLDPRFHAQLRLAEAPATIPTPDSLFGAFADYYQKDGDSASVDVAGFAKEIDLREGGPYANYNWELLFHIPLAVAVHLSKSQRFAEAQRWFHFIFDPTCTDPSVEPPGRYWKFLRFRQLGDPTQIDELLALLSKTVLEPAEEALKQSILDGYEAIRNKPFRPHAVARVRHVAYQYSVVMKYLDNLVAWGDTLFRQDTLESINEATQLYVLASNLLGPRPQRIPPLGKTRAKTFAQLKAQGLDAMGNALVELEGAFPLNLAAPHMQSPAPDAVGPLLGIGRTLYFCIPRNDKLLGYWDTVTDRLFKLRNCLNIEGVVRQLALFDPPIDPALLVKAGAAGIDIGSIVAGLNQPVGSMRCLFYIQKALELAGEVRGLGSALLSAIERRDGERLALLRQQHEIAVAGRQQELLFLRWKQAQDATALLLKTRASALERYRYYQLLLGSKADSNAVPEQHAADRRELNAENFDEAYAALVAQYDRPIPLARPKARKAHAESDPAASSSATGLSLSANEDRDLNELAPEARALMVAATVNDSIGESLLFVPPLVVAIHYWGIGSDLEIPFGELFGAGARIVSGALNTAARIKGSEGDSATKTASYERRTDEWMHQSNLAAHELMQIGRQVIGSLIAEQAARRECLNVQEQHAQAAAVADELAGKFSNEELYGWMQGELSRLYHEYYRFAFDTARRAEQTMKRELMRPEVDATDHIKFGYWDGGRKGLLSGEALYLDIKRMEMAYHEHNKREYELTRHVSLRQVDPIALLVLKATGRCEVSIPEPFFDKDCPGHYLRRIKQVAVSIPAVAGPYTSLNCTLTLLRSSVRKSPALRDGEYARQQDDDRFADYFGPVQSIVTSTGNTDGGLFEAHLRDERFLPFEGAGAMSTWRLEVPAQLRAFDYASISDVILHLRYTAREGGESLRNAASMHLGSLLADANTSGLALVFSVKHDFPNDWHRFVSGNENLSLTVSQEHFPFFVQGREINLHAARLFEGDTGTASAPLFPDALADMSATLNDDETRSFGLSIAEDPAVLARDPNGKYALVIAYSIQEA